jgi:hypothetical protein
MGVLCSSFYRCAGAGRIVVMVGVVLGAVLAMHSPLGAKQLARGRLSVETEALGAVLDGQPYVVGMGSTLRWTLLPKRVLSPIIGANVGVLSWGAYAGGEFGIDQRILQDKKRTLSAQFMARGGLLTMGFGIPMVTVGGRMRGERFFSDHFGMSTTFGLEYELLMQEVLVPMGVGCVWRF